MDYKAKVTLTDQGWSGWARDAKPNVRSAQVTVQAGSVLNPVTVGARREDFADTERWFYEFLVERVTAEQVCFQYKHLVVKNPGGGIDLTAQPGGRLWLWHGRTVELATQTMDAGTIVTVTVDAIE